MASFEINLQGTVLAYIDFTVTGPNAFKREKKVDVHVSSKASTTFDNLPAGTAYEVVAEGESVDGVLHCKGSAPFAITAGGTSQVAFTLQCKGSPKTGSLLATGYLNECPELSVESGAAEVLVGESTQLAAKGSDADEAPKPLSYQWTATSGVLSDPTSAKTELHCTEAGIAEAKVAVSDGDCTEERTTTVECSAACPMNDHNPCTAESCESDGVTTVYEQSPWTECDAAASTLDHCDAVITEAQLPLLEACATQLGEALANSEDETTMGEHWAALHACAGEPLGCEVAPPPPQQLKLLTAQANNKKGPFCKKTEFLACRDAANQRFSIDMQACLAVAPLGKGKNWAACMLQASTKWMLNIKQCGEAASCDPGQVCEAEQCIDTINVISASYGSACGPANGNVTGAVQGQCDGKRDCDIYVHNSVFGDPFYGCPKNFDVSWQCGATPGIHTASHGQVTAEGYSVGIGCP
ncbi:MAG TPA: hypothetical protein VJN18_34300 [Polyangiaceae bacterium]|nr:hypothetical protein [Polyangiaceae bacterium]